MNPPTPLELMAFADGELDPNRSLQVEAWLRENSQGNAYIRSLTTLGNLVREASPPLSSPKSWDIADAVLQRVGIPLQPPQNPLLQVTPTAPLSFAERRRSKQRHTLWSGVAVAVAFSAAAAGLVLWRATHAFLAGTSASSFTLPSVPLETVEPTQVPTRIAFDEGTAIDTVDFGSRTGTIFYVPGQNQNTTVVWITDEEASHEPLSPLGGGADARYGETTAVRPAHLTSPLFSGRS